MSNKPDSQPAYFLSLEVENVRCFGPRQTLDVSDGNGRPAQWTVILGDNGVGKTTLLQCLVVLEPVLWFGSKNNEFAPRFFYDRSGFEDILLYRLSSDKPMYLVSSIFYGAPLQTTSQTGKIWETFGLYLDRSKNRNSSIGEECLSGLVVYGYGASRRMQESAPVTEKEEKLGNWETLFDEDTALGNAEEWLLKTDYAAKSATTKDIQKKIEDRRDAVIKILKQILPDIEDIQISQLTSPDQKVRVQFKTPYGWVSVRSLGIGHRTMIAWVVDLARRLFERYPDSPDPLAEPAVVLVDEIDLHLHPKWQRQIITYLSERFPNTQFIVTAHSPLIVQAAVSVKANIVVLKREGDHVIIEQNIEAVRGWRVDQILTSDLFELESARPPDWDQLFARREALLSRSSLSESELAELKTIRQKISELPTGETVQEMEAMDLIRRAAQELKQRGVQPK